MSNAKLLTRTAHGDVSLREVADRAFATWPQDKPTSGAKSDLDARIYVQYLGVLTVLGRVMKDLPRNHAERYGARRAFLDANIILRRKGAKSYFEHSSGGGFALFDER